MFIPLTIKFKNLLAVDMFLGLSHDVLIVMVIIPGGKVSLTQMSLHLMKISLCFSIEIVDR